MYLLSECVPGLGTPKLTRFYSLIIPKNIETRLTTSISSEARRNQTSILKRGRENMCPPKPDGQTDRQTYRRTDGH